MNTSKKDSGGRRDLGNRASPSNRAHVKRPLDCWQYSRMLGRAKETMARRGETGDKAGNEVPLVLKRCSPVGPFALPGLNWLKMKCLHSSYMFTYMQNCRVCFDRYVNYHHFFFNSPFQVFYHSRILVHEILHGASSLLEYRLVLEIKREEKILGKRIRKILRKTVELQTCEKNNSFITLTFLVCRFPSLARRLFNLDTKATTEAPVSG